jgi:hypothetical protein
MNGRNNKHFPLALSMRLLHRVESIMQELSDWSPRRRCIKSLKTHQQVTPGTEWFTGTLPTEHVKIKSACSQFCTFILGFILYNTADMSR